MIMAQPKAPDIPRPAKKKYRTTDDYISGFTRHCSNEFDSHMAPPPVYAPWLTPDHARSVALIAKENTIEQAVRWIKRENENGGCKFDGWEEQFRQAMMEVEV